MGADEVYLRMGGRWAYCYRAIDEDQQVIGASVSERRNAATAQAFLERAITETDVRLRRVTSGSAETMETAGERIVAPCGDGAAGG
jgi:transposase-like protein